MLRVAVFSSVDDQSNWVIHCVLMLPVGDNNK